MLKKILSFASFTGIAAASMIPFTDIPVEAKPVTVYGKTYNLVIKKGTIEELGGEEFIKTFPWYGDRPLARVIMQKAYPSLRRDTPGLQSHEPVFMPWIHGVGMAAWPEAYQYCDQDGYCSGTSGQRSYTWTGWHLVPEE